MQLRRIESLCEIIAGQHAQIDIYRREIETRLATARKLRQEITYRDHRTTQAEALEDSVPELEEQIRTLEGTIIGHHESIQQLSQGLDDDALRLLLDS